MAMHQRWRGAGLSNNALLVVECDGPVAPERLRGSVERFLDVCPWPGARLRRPFPWGELHWAAAARRARMAPPVRHCAVTGRQELGRALEDELNAAIDPRREPPLRALVVDVEAWSEAPAVLALTWFHPLMDPRGAQTLLAHLAHLDERGAGRPTETAPALVAARPGARPLAERGRLARQSLDYMRTLAPAPPVSPGTGRDGRGSRQRFHQASFAEAEPGADPRATREISWRLAVVGRAMAELWKRRGLPDAPFLVPIAIDLRPAGEPGLIFGNQLAFHFARFRPSETADVPALARTLRARMADAVREGQVEANRVSMEFLHHRPLWAMLRPLPWMATGETFSFNCADIGEFPPGLARLFGRRVLGAYHAPGVLPRPGIGVFFNRCAGRHNLVVSWVEGSVEEDEAARVMEVVREGMGWVQTP